MARKVAIGLARSNGSPTPDLGLSHLQADDQAAISSHHDDDDDDNDVMMS